MYVYFNAIKIHKYIIILYNVNWSRLLAEPLLTALINFFSGMNFSESSEWEFWLKTLQHSLHSEGISSVNSTMFNEATVVIKSRSPICCSHTTSQQYELAGVCESGAEP